jgi:hypothetical protein
MLQRRRAFIAILIGMSLATAAVVWAHCDTMNGPVVTTGQKSLESGNLTPTLKWLKPQHEAELRTAFAQAIAARKQGDAAKQVADRYFLETLVRLHRAGEAQPFTGLKGAGEGVTPAVTAADKALEDGQIDAVVKMLTDEVAKGARERFERARQARAHADENVNAGREFVASYVEFVHYVERIEAVAKADSAHGAHHE